MLKKILSGAAWNLAGFVLPALVAFASVPILVHLVGTERFGVLSLVWAVIGMFSVLDLGIGRALTKWIAELLGANRDGEVPDVISSTTGVAMLVSIAMGAALLIVTLQRGVGLVATSPELASEAYLATIVLALGVSLTVYSAVLRGALEGYSDFQTANLIKIPTGIAMFVLPCVTAWFTPGLPVAVGAMVLARGVANAVMAHQLGKRASYNPFLIRRELVRELMHTGGWITVSNVVSPMIVYLDRFIIGLVLAATAVSYYAVPADALSRILVIPISLAAALFPQFASNSLNSTQFRRIVRRAFVWVMAITAPIAIIASLAAEFILTHWVGPAFAIHSHAVFSVLAIGFCINGAGQVPFLALQAVGASRTVALWHSAQLIPYAAFLYCAVLAYGILGAAVVWTARVAIDTAFLYIALGRRLVPNDDRTS